MRAKLKLQWKRWACCCSLIFLATGAWSFEEPEFNLHRLPGKHHDDVFFDNLGWNLTQGNGFAYDFESIAWRQPYLAKSPTDTIAWINQVRAQGKTMGRAPGYPAFLATIYSTVGRDFSIVRGLQIVLLAAGLATLLIWAGEVLACPWLAVAGACTLALDFAVLRTPGQIMSESLGTVLVAASVMMAVRTFQTNSFVSAISLGTVFGLAILVRSNLSVWLVGFFMLFAIWQVGSFFIRQAVPRPPAKPFFAFVLGVALICGPWWARNCMLSGSFAPLGTGGSIGMVGGYCDRCLAEGGNWSAEAVVAVEQEVMGRESQRGKSSIQHELAIGAESRKQATDWLAASPLRAGILSSKKAVSHLGLGRPLPPLIRVANATLLLSALAMCLWSKSPLGYLILILSFTSVAATMLTWSHFGRYSIPIRPLWHVASAWTIVKSLQWLLYSRKTEGHSSAAQTQPS